MDIVSTIFKELFNIKFIHPAYTSTRGNNIFDDIRITIDEETQKAFNGYNITYRCINDSLIVFIQSERVFPAADEPKVAFISLPNSMHIRLLLTAQPSFFSNSYVTATGSRNVYHFTNTINNIQGGNKYLTKVIDPFDAGKSYDAGTIVSNSGKNYSAIKPMSGVDGIAITDTAFWKVVGPTMQVVNNADIEDKAVIAVDEPFFAVIDIYNNGTTNTAYNLFNASSYLLSPVYVIPFQCKI